MKVLTEEWTGKWKEIAHILNVNNIVCKAILYTKILLYQENVSSYFDYKILYLFLTGRTDFAIKKGRFRGGVRFKVASYDWYW